MKRQIVLALLTFVINGTMTLDISRLFWIPEPSEAPSSDPQVVEVVRWRQPVCIAPAKDVPPCLLGLQKLQTEHEQASKVKKSAAIKDSDEITGILSPEIVDSFPLDSLESAEWETENLELGEKESRRDGETPELEEEHERSVRHGKYLVMPNFGKVMTSNPPPIYVTKVLNSPVTATLIAQNCFPDISVPLCEEYQPTTPVSQISPETDSPAQGHQPGNFWEDPASPYFDDDATSPVTFEQASQTSRKPILQSLHDMALMPDIATKPVINKFVNVKQTVQSIFSPMAHGKKQNATIENSVSVHGSAGMKVGLIESIHSLLGKGTIAKTPAADHAEYPIIEDKPSTSSDVGDITDNIQKQQSFLQNFRDIVRKPLHKMEASIISHTNPITNNKPYNPQQTFVTDSKVPSVLDERHSFIQTFHGIVRKPFKKIESSIISPSEPPAVNEPEPSQANADINNNPPKQPNDKRLILQTIQKLVKKPYQQFHQPPITETYPNTTKSPHVNRLINNAQQPEVKPIFASDTVSTSKPSLFEHFWQPGAIFETRTTATANPRSSSRTPTESPAASNDWQEDDKRTTASDSNVGKSISETLIEVPKRPASANAVRQPENGVDDKESEVPAKPVEEPGLLDTSNPVKPTVERERRDLSKGIFGSLGHAFGKPTDQPLLAQRPGEKPLLVEQPIYVVRQPTSYGKWWNIFLRPSPTVVDADHEIISGPVYVYEKPQQQPGILGSFLSKSGFAKKWNILGKHRILNYEQPTIANEFVEISGQTSNVVRYPQESTAVRINSNKTVDASGEHGHKNILDDHRQPAQALDN